LPLPVLQVAGLVLLFGVALNTLFVWMPTYLMHFVKPPAPHALLINTVCMVILIAAMPVAVCSPIDSATRSFLPRQLS
jgi:hypothetical protein